jgi:hypothetical protein
LLFGLNGSLLRLNIKWFCFWKLSLEAVMSFFVVSLLD